MKPVRPATDLGLGSVFRSLYKRYGRNFQQPDDPFFNERWYARLSVAFAGLSLATFTVGLMEVIDSGKLSAVDISAPFAFRSSGQQCIDDPDHQVKNVTLNIFMRQNPDGTTKEWYETEDVTDKTRAEAESQLQAKYIAESVTVEPDELQRAKAAVAASLAAQSQ